MKKLCLVLLLIHSTSVLATNWEHHNPPPPPAPVVIHDEDDDDLRNTALGLMTGIVIGVLIHHYTKEEPEKSTLDFTKPLKPE
jgi:hypothetical protein